MSCNSLKYPKILVLINTKGYLKNTIKNQKIKKERKFALLSNKLSKHQLQADLEYSASKATEHQCSYSNVKGMSQGFATTSFLSSCVRQNHSPHLPQPKVDKKPDPLVTHCMPLCSLGHSTESYSA